MIRPLGPLNPQVNHVDPKTGRFTTEGYNYFANLAQVVTNLQDTVTAQQTTIETLQKGQAPSE